MKGAKYVITLTISWLLISNGCHLIHQNKIPQLWLQIGEPRTASTLQFITLILFGHALCGEHMNFAFCEKKNFTECVTNITALSSNRHQLLIIKSHQFPHIYQTPNNSFIFLSITNNNSIYTSNYDNDINKYRHQYTLKYNRRFPVIQLMNSIYHTDSIPLVNYAKLFINKHTVIGSSSSNININNKLAGASSSILLIDSTQIDHISIYIKLWSIIRRCCSGSQMSDYWRHILTNSTTTDATNTNTKGATTGKTTIPLDLFHHTHTIDSITNPMCNIYNLTAVEEELFNFAIMTNLPLPAYQIGYCHCSNTITKNKRIITKFMNHYEECNVYKTVSAVYAIPYDGR